MSRVRQSFVWLVGFLPSFTIVDEWCCTVYHGTFDIYTIVLQVQICHSH